MSKVLVACEESQAVCKAFRALGHEAFSCDIQEPSGGHPEWHILGDVLPLINGMHNLIMALSPKVWFIENPRGGMRKMDFMSGLQRYTVTYCQYGDTRMKPTDIWTNHPDPKFKPPCHNGDTCHVSAPRGARTGTQGLKGCRERSVIPEALCQHIVDICEEVGGDHHDLQCR